MKAPLLSTLALGTSAAFFVVLFLPWERGYGSFSGWETAADVGWIALAVILVELLRQRRAWVSQSYALVGFVLTAGEALLGAKDVADVGTSPRLPPGSAGFSNFAYGAWIGLGLVVVLILISVARFVTLGASPA